MKKVIAAAVAACVAVTAFSVTSLAAATPTHPAYTALANDPTIDGVINASEYGPVFAMSSSNASPWVGTISTTVNYSFAWSSKGLYVAVSNPAGKAGTPKTATDDAAYADNYQINVNPGNKIPSGDPGIFFSLRPLSDGTVNVLRHNYNTPDVGDDTPGGHDISDKVTAKCNTSNGVTFEVFIPTAQFQVVGQTDPSVDLTSWTPTAGSPFGLGTYAIVSGDDGTDAFTSLFGAGVDSSDVSDSTDGAFVVQSLGTLTLQAAAASSSSAPASSAPASSAPASSAPASSAPASSAPASSAPASSAPASSAPASSYPAQSYSTPSSSSSAVSSAASLSDANLGGGNGNYSDSSAAGTAAPATTGNGSSNGSNPYTGSTGVMGAVVVCILAAGTVVAVKARRK